VASIAFVTGRKSSSLTPKGFLAGSIQGSDASLGASFGSSFRSFLNHFPNRDIGLVLLQIKISKKILIVAINGYLMRQGNLL
jgi:hypothetical protein